MNPRLRGTSNRAAPSPRIELPACLQVEADPRATLASEVMNELKHTMGQYFGAEVDIDLEDGMAAEDWEVVDEMAAHEASSASAVRRRDAAARGLRPPRTGDPRYRSRRRGGRAAGAMKTAAFAVAGRKGRVTCTSSGDAVPDGNAATAATAAHAVVAPDRRSSTATNSGGAAAAATAPAAAAPASHALGTSPPHRFTAGVRERGVEDSMVNVPTTDALKPPYFLQAKHHNTVVRATASAKQQQCRFG